MSIRDLLSWVNFINICSNGSTSLEDNDDHRSDKILLSSSSAYVHGACLVFLDALGSTSSPSSSSVFAMKDAYQTCLEFLRRQVHVEGNETSIESEEFDTNNDRGDFFGVHPFYIKIGIGVILTTGPDSVGKCCYKVVLSFRFPHRTIAGI